MSDDGAGARSVTCARCGAVAADGAPLEWTMQISDRGRVEFLCSDCSRANLRSIEGRLDTDWW
jgi:hypothetical protein